MNFISATGHANHCHPHRSEAPTASFGILGAIRTYGGDATRVKGDLDKAGAAISALFNRLVPQDALSLPGLELLLEVQLQLGNARLALDGKPESNQPPYANAESADLPAGIAAAIKEYSANKSLVKRDCRDAALALSNLLNRLVPQDALDVPGLQILRTCQDKLQVAFSKI